MTEHLCDLSETFLKFVIDRTEEQRLEPGPVGMECHQKKLEAEATARRLAKEAEMELAAELAQKLYIQGEELAARHHKEIEYLAAKQMEETQKLSPEAQETVKSMLKAQAAFAQGPGAIPKQPVKAETVATPEGASSGNTSTAIFKKIDE